MEEGELLVEQLRSRLRVVLQRRRGRRKALEDCFGRDLGYVIEHLPVLTLFIELLWADAQSCDRVPPARTQQQPDPPNVLTRKKTASSARAVVEAEELVAWFELDRRLKRVTPDGEDVGAFLLDDDAFIVELETVTPARKLAHGQRRQLPAGIVSHGCDDVRHQLLREADELRFDEHHEHPVELRCGQRHPRRLVVRTITLSEFAECR